MYIATRRRAALRPEKKAVIFSSSGQSRVLEKLGSHHFSRVVPVTTVAGLKGALRFARYDLVIVDLDTPTEHHPLEVISATRSCGSSAGIALVGGHLDQVGRRSLIGMNAVMWLSPHAPIEPFFDELGSQSDALEKAVRAQVLVDGKVSLHGVGVKQRLSAYETILETDINRLFYKHVPALVARGDGEQEATSASKTDAFAGGLIFTQAHIHNADLKSAIASEFVIDHLLDSRIDCIESMCRWINPSLVCGGVTSLERLEQIAEAVRSDERLSRLIPTLIVQSEYVRGVIRYLGNKSIILHRSGDTSALAAARAAATFAGDTMEQAHKNVASIASRSIARGGEQKDLRDALEKSLESIRDKGFEARVMARIRKFSRKNRD